MINRKSLFFLCCAFLFFIKVQGQKKIHVIFSGMPERTFLTNKWDKENQSLLKKMPSYSIAPGIMVRNELKNRWHLNYGILYSYQAQHFKVYFSNLDGHKDRTILSYMKIPLLLQYNFINKENFSLFVQAGPQLSMLIIEEGAIINHNDIVEVGGAYKSVVMDGVVSFGVEMKIYKDIYYNLQLRFDHSLQPASRSSYEDLNGTGSVMFYDVAGRPRSNEYNMTIGLLNGISIKIR